VDCFVARAPRNDDGISGGKVPEPIGFMESIV
jgi:hypothetical protein